MPHWHYAGEEVTEETNCEFCQRGPINHGKMVYSSDRTRFKIACDECANIIKDEDAIG